MGFQGFYLKRQHTFWLPLILLHVLFIIPSYSQESCTKDGEYKCHETDDSKFYHCTGPKHGILQSCGKILRFNPQYNVCDWPVDGDSFCKTQRDQSKTTRDVGATKYVVTTSKPSNSLKSCRKSNEYKCHETNNYQFYLCTGFETGALKTCPEGTDFNPAASICACSNIPNAFKCHNQDDQSKTTTSKPQLTGPCQPEHCKLPKCKCPGPEIPGSLPTNATPQIILLTFDDGINEHNIGYYRDLFGSNITNPNGCPIQATFFVSGDYTIYKNVKELYGQGHEIASHSKTHKLPHAYWLNSDYETYTDEIVGMKNWLIEKADIPAKDIRGMRSPFLSMGKDAQFKMLKDNRFYYDSSMVTGSVSTTTEIPVWPFTLDYPVIKKYCLLKYCPEKSYPGLWEVPLIRWYNDEGSACSMADSCIIPQNSSAVVNYLKDNFNRHYKRNRAPFGIFLHAPWLKNNLKPLKKFLEEVALKNDVWIVTVSQALQWIQNPVPLDKISEFRNWKCKLNN